MTERRVFIAGAGPVGMMAAARLLAKGVPVTVFEAGDDLSTESRASTFHPSTLDMLDEFGAADRLEVHGLRAPRVQYRSKRDGVLGRFDFGDTTWMSGALPDVFVSQFGEFGDMGAPRGQSAHGRWLYRDLE